MISPPKEQVRYIMNTFDFTRVHLVMKALDWKWGLTLNGPDNIPDVEDLRISSNRMLHSVVDQYIQQNDPKRVINQTGGFTAEMEDGYLTLSFVVEECTNYV